MTLPDPNFFGIKDYDELDHDDNYYDDYEALVDFHADRVGHEIAHHNATLIAIREGREFEDIDSDGNWHPTVFGTIQEE